MSVGTWSKVQLHVSTNLAGQFCIGQYCNGAINRLNEESQETEMFFTFFSLRLFTIYCHLKVKHGMGFDYSC